MRRCILPIFLLTILVVVGCTTKSTEPLILSDSDPSIFHKFLESPPETMDPLRAHDVVSGQIIIQIYDTLFVLDESYNVRPHLVESYTYDPENMNYLFHLRRGVQFTDGSELTAEDIVYTFKRFCLSGRDDWAITSIIKGCNNNASKSEQFGIVAEQKYDVNIKLKSHYPMFLLNLAAHQFSILPANLQGLDKSRYFQNPITTGAYRLMISDDHKVVLEANRKYFLGTPDIKKVVYDIVDSKNLKERISNGEFDDIYPTYSLTRPNNQYIDYRSRLATVCFLGYDISKEPFNNIWFRRALNSVLDKEKIVRSLKIDGIQVAEGFIPYGVLGYLPKMHVSQFNEMDFGTLLKKSGYSPTNLRPFEIYRSNTSTMNNLSELILSELKDVGIKVSSKALDLKDFVKAMRDHEIDLFLGCYQFDQPETYHFLELFKSQYPLRHFSLSDKKYDALLDGALLIEDRLKRGELYKQLNQYIYDRIWTINLYYETYDSGYIKKNYRLPSIGLLGPNYMKIRDIKIVKEFQ